MSDKRVTGKDVARLAGVTTATVSNVLNGKRNVSEGTRERVLAAVRDLGYVPDQAAKALRRRRTRAIGVVIEKNLSNPRYGRTVEGMLNRASERGYRIMLCHNRRRENGMFDYLAAYYERQVDAVVFVSRDIEGPDPEALESVERDRIPFVALDCQLESPSFTTIDFDYRGGAYDVAAHVLARRPNRVVYVRPARRNAQEELREEGLRAACDEANLADEPVVLPIDISGFSESDMGELDPDGSGRPSASYLYRVSDLLRTAAAGVIRARDAIISSWAGWSNTLSRSFPLPGVVFADLASDYLSIAGADIYGEMPNGRAGRRCIDAAIDLVEGGSPRTELLGLGCYDLTLDRP